MTNKTLAIVGFVLSFFTTIPGLIVSIIALKKMNDAGETDGKGFAIAGMVIGIVTTAIALLSIGCTACAICAAGAAGGFNS